MGFGKGHHSKKARGNHHSRRKQMRKNPKRLQRGDIGSNARIRKPLTTLKRTNGK